MVRDGSMQFQLHLQKNITVYTEITPGIIQVSTPLFPVSTFQYIYLRNTDLSRVSIYDPLSLVARFYYRFNTVYDVPVSTEPLASD